MSYRSDSTHLGLDSLAITANTSSQDGKGDELLVLHDLGSCKGRQSLDEELGSLLELANGDVIQALVDLETIPTVPITSCIDQSAGQWE